MTRPRKTRYVSEIPEVRFFKPAGIPMADLTEVALLPDELEAMRLVHIDGLYQEQAARIMAISRQTLGRILAEAHRKITEALLMGRAIRIEDAGFVEYPGRVESIEKRRCLHGRHGWRGGKP
ncbi:hypothetical protein DRQ36_09875 [bacterium]|nr:MAG: hypothetical protein DRQ36_09875 [bacterium]